MTPLTRATLIAGIASSLMAGSANAAIIFNTDAAGTGFGGTSLVQNNSLGATATLTYIPTGNSTTGTPSNVNFGNFTLVCESCSTQNLGAGSFFSPFTFNLILTDVTDGATGMFVGTSTGGTVYSDVSQLTITWAPLQLGPGSLNVLSGNFGPTTFTTTAFTGIVAPNSGAVPGQSTIQGFVDSAATVPEPSTFGMMGAALIGLGLLRRRYTRP